jgi:hypothetical protein
VPRLPAGLNLLHELLLQFAGSEFATQFHQAYYLQLVQEIFAVLTDTFHKPGFKLQARILHHLFSIVQVGRGAAPCAPHVQKSLCGRYAGSPGGAGSGYGGGVKPAASHLAPSLRALRGSALGGLPGGGNR